MPTTNHYEILYRSRLNTPPHNTQQTFRKYCVDCVHFSSNNPASRISRVRNIENISILPITLKLGLCINFSTCIGERLNGYWIPAFCDGALSNALVNSKLLPPQQTLRGSVDTALNNSELSKTVLFITGTSRPQ